MKNKLKLALPLVMLCLVVGISSQARAMEMSGHASTVLEWFDDAQGDTAAPLYQYLNLNIRDITDKGWDFRTYGRLSGDINDKVDADSELYYAYFEKRDVLNNLDLRIGRQFVANTAGASIVDGLYLDYQYAKYNLTLFGGGDAKFDDSYHSDDLVFGGEVASRFFNRLELAASYYQRWDQGDLGYELIGLDAEYNYKPVNLYGDFQYSLLTKETTYLLAGAHYATNTPWNFTAEYLYSLPVFTSTSIYSVFAVDEYQELMAEAAYMFDRSMRGFFRLTREVYESVDDATVFEAGIEKYRVDKIGYYLLGTYRNDPDGQGLYGFKAHVSYLFPDVLSKKVEAGVGAHVDVIERQIQFLADSTIGEDETTSTRLWVDSTVYLTPTINVQGKVEYLESAFWDNYYRGRVRLNFLF